MTLRLIGTKFRVWLRTPKVYPNGGAFTPSQQLGYTLLTLATIAALLWVVSWAVRVVVSTLAGNLH